MAKNTPITNSTQNSNSSATAFINAQEIGTTGLAHMGGHVYDEFLKELYGYRAARAYREISENSPIASGIILGYQNVASHLDWHIEEPDDPSAGDTAAFEFVRDAFDDMNESWDSTLSQILSMITFGYSFHEIVYKKRNGKDSKFSDGKIGWRKFPIRAQESLYEWMFGDNGEILGMVQRDPSTGQLYAIPHTKALLFRTTELKNNPEGLSLLRGAYIPYQYLRRIQEYEAIGVERDLAGLPVAWVPNDWLSSNDPNTRNALNRMIQMVRDVRRNEREGLVLPMMYEPELTGSISRNRALDFQLLSSGGTRQFDTDAIITRYNQQIAMSLLADFITLGQDGIGSFALGTAKLDLWIMVVDSLCKSIAEVFNKHAIKRLLDLNGIKYDNPPTLEYGTVENVDIGVLATAINSVAQAGLLTPDEGLESWVRTQFGMPPVDDTGVMPPAAIDMQREAVNSDMAQQAMKQNLAGGGPVPAGRDGKPLVGAAAVGALSKKPADNKPTAKPGEPTTDAAKADKNATGTK